MQPDLRFGSADAVEVCGDGGVRRFGRLVPAAVEGVQIELERAEIATQATEHTETPEEEVTTTPTMRKRQAEEDALLQPALDLFDARILDINI